MNRYREIIGRINYALFLAVVALLPFPQICVRYACVAWFVTWVLEGRWLQKPASWRENKMMLPFVLFGIWYIWQLVSGIWADNHAAWSMQMERYITFGVMIPVGIWGLNSMYDWRKAGKVFVIGCICAALFYPALLTLLLFHREIIDSLNWIAPWDYSSFEWWHFYQINLSHIKFRLILCSIDIFAIILIPQVWEGEKYRRLRIFLIAVLTLSILISGSRQSIVTLIIVCALSFIMNMPEPLRLKQGGLFLLGAMILCGIAIAIHPRTLNTINEPRLELWEIATEHPSDYFWSGLGAGQNHTYIVRRFIDENKQVDPSAIGHCHNQYLQELMELGIGGLLFFIIAWLSIPLCAQHEGRRTAILFSTLYGLNMCTDRMFGIYCGVALWSVGLLFILLQSDTHRQQQTTGSTEA